MDLVLFPAVFSAFALKSVRSCALAFVCSSAGQHGTRHTTAYSEAERLVQTKMLETWSVSEETWNHGDHGLCSALAHPRAAAAAPGAAGRERGLGGHPAPGALLLGTGDMLPPATAPRTQTVCRGGTWLWETGKTQRMTCTIRVFVVPPVPPCGTTAVPESGEGKY